LRAIQNVRLICEEQLPGRHELEVIDIYQHVGQLATGQVVVVVAPTLVRQSPLPVRRLVGDLSTRNRVECWRGWTSLPASTTALKPQTRYG
jgi:circadian clock protein KaiB